MNTVYPFNFHRIQMFWELIMGLFRPMDNQMDGLEQRCLSPPACKDEKLTML
jgi:hypothetical protein